MNNHQHIEMEMTDMGDKTVFERLEIAYEEKDGLFYPLIFSGTEAVASTVGKYGRMWIQYMKSEYPVRYRSLVRFAEMEAKVLEVNEYAYEFQTDIENLWLKKHKPKNSSSFIEMYQLRSQARMIAEEMVMHEIVNQFH